MPAQWSHDRRLRALGTEQLARLKLRGHANEILRRR